MPEVAQGKPDKQTMLRHLPSVDSLLQQPETGLLFADFGRLLTVETIRAALNRSREQLLSGEILQPPSANQLISDAHSQIVNILAPTLYPVINATGVIIHTNLGRAPLSQAALAAIQSVAQGYSTLEYSPEAGERGSRTVHAEQYLRRITGAEAALVVNNNAAGVLLMLTTLCSGREVIISRGQLVEIGGGFRVPDVMAQSGATLVEVGTTNRTHLRDYEKAINEETAAIMVAHPSNYRIIGFTSEPSLADLVELAHAHHIPLLFDQGSGALLDVTPYGLDPEPTVREGLKAGVNVIAFSGDKLLGGPQAGILCGEEDLISQLKQHPLARAVRADKLCLSALSATLAHYLKEEALHKIPVWRMIARPLESIVSEATRWATHLQEHGVEATVLDGHSRVGGGSLPGTTLPTKLVTIRCRDAEALAFNLRQSSTPVISRIQDGRVLLDPRTVMPHEGQTIVSALLEICV